MFLRSSRVERCLCRSDPTSQSSITVFATARSNKTKKKNTQNLPIFSTESTPICMIETAKPRVAVVDNPNCSKDWRLRGPTERDPRPVSLVLLAVPRAVPCRAAVRAWPCPRLCRLWRRAAVSDWPPLLLMVVVMVWRRRCVEDVVGTTLVLSRAADGVGNWWVCCRGPVATAERRVTCHCPADDYDFSRSCRVVSGRDAVLPGRKSPRVVGWRQQRH